MEFSAGGGGGKLIVSVFFLLHYVMNRRCQEMHFFTFVYLVFFFFIFLVCFVLLFFSFIFFFFVPYKHDNRCCIPSLTQLASIFDGCGRGLIDECCALHLPADRRALNTQSSFWLPSGFLLEQKPLYLRLYLSNDFLEYCFIFDGERGSFCFYRWSIHSSKDGPEVSLL